MTKRQILGGICAVAIGVTVGSALVPLSDPGALIALYWVDTFVPVVGGSVAVGYVIRHPASAPSLLGVGLYMLALAAVFAVLPVHWFLTDHTDQGLGLVVLAYLTALLAVPLVAISGELVLRRQQGARAARPLRDAAVGAVVTSAVLVARGPGDWAAGVRSVHLYSFPLVVLAAALCLAILDRAGQEGPRDEPLFVP